MTTSHTNSHSFPTLFAEFFGLATFFGALTWVVQHTVDRLVDSPTIEYEITRKRIGDDRSNLWEIRANVINLSRKNTFRNAKFLFVSRSDENGNALDTLFDVNQDHTEMVFHGPALPEGKRRAKVQIPGAEFVVPVLAPGARVELITRYFGKDEPRFVGAPSVEGSESFALVEKSIVTLLVAHELSAMVGILVLWLLILGWRSFRKGQPREGQKRSTDRGNSVGMSAEGGG